MATVLVIDNSADDRRDIRNLLEPHKIDVVEADSLTSDLDVLGAADVVVIDPVVADIAGPSVVQAMKAKHPKLPVIVVSVVGNEALVIRALQNGAVSYVPKTSLKQELLKTVRDVLEVARGHESRGRVLSRRNRMTCCFELENDRKLLSCVVDHLQKCCSDFGLFDGNNELTRLGMALEEAMANAMLHGNLEVSSALRDQEGNCYEETARQRIDEAPYRDRRILVTATFTPHEAEFIIEDEGNGFAHDDIPDPTDPGKLERVSGRGVLLMRTFMDYISFNEKGNQVTMRKSWPASKT